MSKGKQAQNANYWNICDPDMGHVSCQNTEQFDEIERVPEVIEEDENFEQVYAVILPQFQHGEKRCRGQRERIGEL